jgi:hypothetical protein
LKLWNKKENQEFEKYHQILNHHENLLQNQIDTLDPEIDREIVAVDQKLDCACSWKNKWTKRFDCKYPNIQKVFVFKP